MRALLFFGGQDMRGYPMQTMAKANHELRLAWLTGLALLYAWLGFVYFLAWLLGM